ncbi:MAG: DNA gyrase inhibitor YacG [Pyrinomonadaceae bacterium]|nr:DNA gyrase inhibitor YacG [Pyrinomonadaceae bacterium]
MVMVKCPNCSEQTEYSENEFRPFCSERCKLIDFGVWAEGGYAVPAESASLTAEDIEVIERVRQERGNS